MTYPFFYVATKHFFRFLAAVRSTPPEIEKNATNGRTDERTNERTIYDFRFTIFVGKVLRDSVSSYDFRPAVNLTV